MNGQMGERLDARWRQHEPELRSNELRRRQALAQP